MPSNACPFDSMQRSGDVGGHDRDGRVQGPDGSISDYASALKMAAYEQLEMEVSTPRQYYAFGVMHAPLRPPQCYAAFYSVRRLTS